MANQMKKSDGVAMLVSKPTLIFPYLKLLSILYQTSILQLIIIITIFIVRI